MKRVRVLLGLVALSFALGAMPAFAGENVPAEGDPVVVVGEDAEPPAEDAWTFRFLVPTLLALTGVVVAGVVLAYGVRVAGRYRVSR
jgi:hypothetical protein